MRNTFALVAAVSLSTFSARADGTNLTIGYCTGDLAAAKAAGFDYAEIRIREFARLSEEDFAKFAARYQAAGLPTTTAHWFFPAEMKVVGPDVHTNEVMSYLQMAFARCQKLGVKIVVWGSGDSRRAPEGFSRDEAFQQLVALAKRITPDAQKHGLVIVAEPLRKAESNTINSAAEALQWVEAVNDPNFELLVDIYHMAEENEDPAIILKTGSHLKHVHMSNPVGRVFPLRTEEYDYAPFFKALNQVGYRGLISIEAKTDNLAKDGPQAIAFLRAEYTSAGKPSVKNTAPSK